MGKVPALVQAHTQNGIARLHQRGVGCQVGVGAAMGLDVGELAVKQLAGALAGQVLDHIHLLATAVVAARGIALGIFVGKHRAHRLEHGGASKVLRCDQLDGLALARKLVIDRGGDLGVGVGKGFHEHVWLLYNHVVLLARI